MSLFNNPDFYPTPQSVLDMMSIDCLNKIVLEPSSGSGNIIDYLKLNGAKEVIACEKHPELKVISASKCKVIAEDFFSVTEDMVSHINMIVMNPPFDLGSKHILHAWTKELDTLDLKIIVYGSCLIESTEQLRVKYYLRSSKLTYKLRSLTLLNNIPYLIIIA